MKDTTRNDQPSIPSPVPILIVDDDPSSVKLLAAVFTADGYDVRTAPSAEDAEVVLRSFAPRIIILDLVLPQMSGLHFAERLKADPSTAGIVLVAVTAMNGPETERIALGAGFAACMRKPVDPLTITKLVAEHLGGIP